MKTKPTNKAIFIDRDGTINEDYGYTYLIEKFRFLPRAIEGLKILSTVGYKMIIITNQSGIGRGYYTAEQYHTLTDYILKELAKYHIRIDRVYYCPHHPDEKCTCRKPEIGMLQQAQQDFNLNLKECIMIGDRDPDIEAGKRAGCTTIMVRNEKSVTTLTADVVVDTLYDAAVWIKGNRVNKREDRNKR